MSDSPLTLTRAEYERYEQQLNELRRRRETDLPQLLRDARTYVSSDASEEMLQIVEDHAFVDARIAELDRLLQDATVADDDLPADAARVGCRVEVEYARTGRTVSYRLDGTAGSRAGTVSARSPVGRALLGARVGDVVSVDLPSGRSEVLRVLAVGADEREAA